MKRIYIYKDGTKAVVDLSSKHTIIRTDAPTEIHDATIENLEKFFGEQIEPEIKV